MMRLAALALLATLVAFPLGILPGPPVTWLAATAFVVGAAGVAVLAVPFVTAGAGLALVAYGVALVMGPPTADPVGGVVIGGLLVLLLALVHLAARVDGAAVGPRVLVREMGEWLAVVAAGMAAAAALALAGAGLAAGMQGLALPTVIVAAALGAVMAVAGVIAFVLARDA